TDQKDVPTASPSSERFARFPEAAQIDGFLLPSVQTTSSEPLNTAGAGSKSSRPGRPPNEGRRRQSCPSKAAREMSRSPLTEREAQATNGRPVRGSCTITGGSSPRLSPSRLRASHEAWASPSGVHAEEPGLSGWTVRVPA